MIHPILEAINVDNIDNLSKLITKENINEIIDCTYSKERNQTPLYYATQLCKLNSIRFLIRNGAKVNMPGYKMSNSTFIDTRPIHVSRIYMEPQYFPIFELLVKNGANPCEFGKEKNIVYNSVIRASSYLNLPVIKYLFNTCHKNDYKKMMKCLEVAIDYINYPIYNYTFKRKFEFIKYLWDQLKHSKYDHKLINYKINTLPNIYGNLLHDIVVDENDRMFVIF